jgi:hypothetical protein
MGMNPETGDIRALNSKDDLKPGEVLFTEGELIDIRGCLFLVKQVFPNPDNELVLKGAPTFKKQEADMI